MSFRQGKLTRADSSDKLILRVPKSFRRNGSLQVNNSESLPLGSDPISVLSFHPDSEQMSSWFSLWVMKLTPSSLKCYWMQRDLQRLNAFYSGLQKDERARVTLVMDIPSVMRRIYEAISIEYPRNIRLMAHAVLDHVLWSRLSRTSASIVTPLYPPDTVNPIFQLSRIDYLIATHGAEATVQELQLSGDLLSTVKAALESLGSPDYDSEFSLLIHLEQMVHYLPPTETLILLESHMMLPIPLRRALFEHLERNVAAISRPSRFSKMVDHSIGQILFMWCILEPQCNVRGAYDVKQALEVMDIQQSSKRIFRHLRRMKYPFLKKRACKRLLKHHPFQGVSLVRLVDHALLADYPPHVQKAISRTISSEEHAKEMIEAIKRESHPDHSIARYLWSKLGFLPSWEPNAMLHLRILGQHVDLDESARLMIFEGMSNSLHTLQGGYSLEQLSIAIDGSIGLDLFLMRMVDCFRPRGSEDLSFAVHICIQNYVAQILVKILDDSAFEFAVRVRENLVQLEKLQKKVKLDELGTKPLQARRDFDAWESMVKNLLARRKEIW